MGDGRSLFITCLPRDTREEDVRSVFKHYGPIVSCDIRSGGNFRYAFVQYENGRDAEDAKKEEHGRDFRGNRIMIEWVKGRGRRARDSYYGRGYDRRHMPSRRWHRSYSISPLRNSVRRSPSYSPRHRASRSLRHSVCLQSPEQKDSQTSETRSPTRSHSP